MEITEYRWVACLATKKPNIRTEMTPSNVALLDLVEDTIGNQFRWKDATITEFFRWLETAKKDHKVLTYSEVMDVRQNLRALDII